MARPPRRAHEIEQTRREILAAAARVFAASGYHGATMQAIAREAGFTAASLYGYFGSKDEIYVAILEEAKAAMLATYEAPFPAGLDLRGRLVLLVTRQFQVVGERRELLRLLLDEPPRHVRIPPGPPPEFLARMVAFLTRAEDALRIPAAEATAVLFGILRAYFVPMLRDDAPDAQGLAERLVGYFLDGVAARPARRP